MGRKLIDHDQQLDKVDYISQTIDNNVNELKIMKTFCIQNREDYEKYNYLAMAIRAMAHKIKALDPSRPYRAQASARLLDQLYNTGLIATRWDLAFATSVTAVSFCRRRLPAIMVRKKMCETIQEAIKFIRQGHVRLRARILKDPSFLLTRAQQDYLTWLDGSTDLKHFIEYNDLSENFCFVEDD